MIVYSFRMTQNIKMSNLIWWDIYEISTTSTSINWVMLRGRLRKIWLENEINILAENTTDIGKCVRFALFHGQDPKLFIDYLNTIIDDCNIELIKENLPNPVLSKMKVNIESRYSL